MPRRWKSSRRLGNEGSEPPTTVPRSVRRSVAADAPGGLVLALAAERLDDVSNVRESEGAFGVDGLVHLAEAGSVGGRSVGAAGEAENRECGDGSDGENALHWTFPSVGGCVFTRHC